MKVYNNPIAGSVISKDAGKSEISKDGFYKLLTAELQNQDPLSSKDNTEFVAQMAQFAALEQMNNLNSSMEKLLLSQKLQEGSLMIGKTVKLIADDGTTVTGDVTSVKLSKGQVNIIVDGKEYSIDSVSELSARESEAEDVVSDN